MEKIKNLKIVKCIECYKDNTLIIHAMCCKCDFHKNHKCTFFFPETRIEILSCNSPLRFNRQMFAHLSDSIRNETLNYYTVTTILRSVKNIKDFPNYKKVKTRLLSGHYKEKESPKLEIIDGKGIKGKIFLVDCGDLGSDLTVDGSNYKISDSFVLSDKWSIVYYLYEIFSLDGFADIKLDDKYYVLKTERIDNLKEDLIVAKNENRFVIGENRLIIGRTE